MQKTEVGQLLRSARERAGLTQRQIADLLEVRQTTVSAWETAVSEPNLETIYRWARACGERADLVIGRPGSPDPLSPLLEVVEVRTLEGEVNSAGGDDPWIKLRTRSLGMISCEADRATVREFGGLLYREVAVTGDATVNLLTGKIVRYFVRSYDVLPIRSTPEAMAILLREVTRPLPPFSVDRLIGERSA